MILKAGGTPVGTGFIVAPGLMMTAGYVLQAAGYLLSYPHRGHLEAAGKRPTNGIRLCLGPSKSSCEPSLTIGDVIYVGEAEESKIALANLVDHDIAITPPVLLAEPLPAANALIGQYAFVIGYPFRDARMPGKFTEHLLGTEEGRKRLMPGRILAFGQGPGSVRIESGRQAPPVFTTDISTSGGTGGAPLMELAGGRVIGMSYAGVWKGERGKFAYSESIPEGAVEIIGRRLRGEPEKPPESAPSSLWCKSRSSTGADGRP